MAMVCFFLVYQLPGGSYNGLFVICSLLVYNPDEAQLGPPSPT